MQPNPMAETSRLLFPRLRLCIVAPFCSLLHRAFSSGSSRNLFWTAVLFVADLFHPVNDFAIESFLNRDMRHGCGWRCTMPVLNTSRNPNDIPLANHLNRAAP